MRTEISDAHFEDAGSALSQQHVQRLDIPMDNLLQQPQRVTRATENPCFIGERTISRWTTCSPFDTSRRMNNASETCQHPVSMHPVSMERRDLEAQ
jgi:hypothetical protein